MTIRLTEAAAQEVLDALDVSLDNYELDLLNDDEGAFVDAAQQVCNARNVMARILGKEEREVIEEGTLGSDYRNFDDGDNDEED